MRHQTFATALEKGPACERAEPPSGLETHLKSISITAPAVLCCLSRNATSYREGKSSYGQGEELSVALRGWLGIKRILYGGYTLNL